MSNESKKYNKLTLEQQDKLITIVFRYPHVYDTTAENYGNKTVLKITWQSIAKELNMPGMDSEQCRLKWKNMRDYYNATCKKIKDAVKHRSKIPFQGNLYKRLMFLADHTSNGKAGDVSKIYLGKEERNSNIKEQHDLDEISDTQIEHSSPSINISCLEPLRKKLCTNGPQTPSQSSQSQLSTLHFGETSSEDKLQINFLWEKMKTDYEQLIEKDKELKLELEEKKKLLREQEKGQGNTFYSMMAEKVSSFSKSDQVWMENQIWNLYMNLINKNNMTSSGNNTNSTVNVSNNNGASCTLPP